MPKAPELLNDMDAHDAIHVLFGCPTNLAGEIVAHIWTAFGTTVSIKDMRRVNQHRDHRQVLEQIGHRKLFLTWIRSLPRILKVIIRTKKMKSRWPVEEVDAFADRPLDELRKEFSIRLIPFDPGEGGSGGAALRNLNRKTEQGSGLNALPRVSHF